MTKRDYYEVLEIDRNATDTEIKKAYRRMALQYHPDKHQGDKKVEEKFKEINEAYEALKKPETRAQYDRFGFAGVGRGRVEGPDIGFDFQDIFGDMFGDFFGGGGGRGHRGADLGYELEVSFEESAFGVEKQIKIPKLVRCETCHGNGAQPGTSPVTCSTCGGRGQVKYQRGFFSMAKPCNACRGTGTIIKNPCRECKGTGRQSVIKDLTVKVPPGVEVGTRLRLTGEGEDGSQGGPPGDLYISINVEAHPIFHRQNDDIIFEIPISFPHATLGFELTVPTLKGNTTLTIPPGTQSGHIFGLKGMGFPSLSSRHMGDQNVMVRVETPTNLTKGQQKLLKEFADLCGEETTPLKKGFFNKVKDLLG